MDESILRYLEYRQVCYQAATEDSAFVWFKRHPIYNRILEHVTPEQGLEYLKESQKLGVSFSEIEAFCKLNDSYGSPNQAFYNNSLACSPTSLRYVFQAHLILTHMQQLGLKEAHIVEVGGGYGGLFLAIDFFSKTYGIQLKEYIILDLPEVGLLQQKFLSNYTLSCPFRIENGMKFGRDLERQDYFFVSNYAVSELNDEYLQSYIDILLPKCPHGFLAWNMRPYLDIKKTVRMEEEVPCMCPETNRMIYF